MAEPQQPQQSPEAVATGTSRRDLLRGALLGGVGGLVVGAAGGAVAGRTLVSEDSDATPSTSAPSTPSTGSGTRAGSRRSRSGTPCSRRSGSRPAPRPRDLQVLLARWSAAIAVLQDGRSVGAVQPTSELQPPRDTGEAHGLSPASLTVTLGLGPAVFGERFGLAAVQAGAVLRPAAPERRLPRPEAHRWRPEPAGVRRRPAGQLPRLPQPRPDRPRRRRPLLDGAGLRPGLGRPGAGDPAHAAGVQGRHPQHQDRRRDGPVRVDRPQRPAVARRRLLPGRAQDPDAAGDLGRRPDRRPAADLRARQGRGRPADRDEGVRHPGLHGARRRGRARHQPHRRTSRCRRRRTTAAS